MDTRNSRSIMVVVVGREATIKRRYKVTDYKVVFTPLKRAVK